MEHLELQIEVVAVVVEVVVQGHPLHGQVVMVDQV
jgi:hypothetical protein